MKKFNSILFILFSVASLNAQKEIKSVEKSILSIQTGYFGTWINHELKLHKKFALRTEFGTEYRLKFVIKQSFDSLKNQVSIFLEPKYYFNLKKRESKNKNIKNNAGNYISLRINLNILNNLEIGEFYFYDLTPTFGIRRNITSHFNLEFSCGYGLSYLNNMLISEAMSSMRVGYVF
tara:strand:+ start:6 stop:536 length:531 start_codon:yes stop_codon:yes gene_type:complete